MAKKLVADGRGGFEEVEITKSDASAPAVAAPPAAAPPAAVAPVAPVAAPAADDVAKAKAEKTETVAKLGALAERVLKVAMALHDSDEPLPENFGEEIVAMTESAVTKRRMGKARMDKLESGLATLQELMAELKGEETTKSTVAPAPAAAPVAPVAAAPVAAGPSDDVTKKLAAAEAEIKKLRDIPARSNSGAPGEEGNPGAGSFSWPSDMAESEKTAKNRAQGLTF